MTCESRVLEEIVSKPLFDTDGYRLISANARFNLGTWFGLFFFGRWSSVLDLPRALTTFGIVLLVCHVAVAAPWDSLNPFKSRIEADPDKRYMLGAENGPWMILATTFAGDKAEQEAQSLVIELRKELNLPVYLHRKRFDFSDSVTGLGVNRFGNVRKMRYRQNVSFDEWAVLVGDFSAINLPEVQRTLKKIKAIKPASLSDTQTQRFRGLRDFHKRLNGNSQKRERGPMGSAFVTRNPLLPKEYFSPQGIDKFVYDLNKDREHSLVHCRGKYTVRVASFSGSVVFNQRKIKEIDSGAKDMVGMLADAAAKAEKLVKVLRAKGVEAYQFHDRDESIVTVASFETAGTPVNGKIVIHDSMKRVIKQFRAETVHVAGSAPRLQPKVIANIPCDLEPCPMEVPQYSVSSDYAQAGLFR